MKLALIKLPHRQTPIEHARHRARYSILKTKPFGMVRTIDWDALNYLGLADKIRDMISHGSWEKVFAIDKLGYKELTLEVLSTIKIDKSQYHCKRPESITFQAFGKMHSINHT